MVFFMVFSVRCNAKTGDTMRGRLMLAWYQGACNGKYLSVSGVSNQEYQMANHT